MVENWGRALIPTQRMSAGLTLLACIVAARMQPEDQPFYRSLQLAPVPPSGHVLLPPAMGVVLGCWSAEYPRDLDESTAAYWLVGTGERVDLIGMVDIDGVAYTPRWPQPGVDPATGASLWNANNAAGEWTQVVIVLPGVARSADFNANGVVNTMDVTAFLNAYADQRENE